MSDACPKCCELFDSETHRACELETEVDAWRRKAIDRQAEYETLREELSISHTTCADLEREATEAEAECSRLRGERDEYKVQLDGLHKELRRGWKARENDEICSQRDQARTALAECRLLIRRLREAHDCPFCEGLRGSKCGRHDSIQHEADAALAADTPPGAEGVVMRLENSIIDMLHHYSGRTNLSIPGLIHTVCHMLEEAEADVERITKKHEAAP